MKKSIFMNNEKKYLILATLSITFCVSFQTFAMEKEKSRASHEWFEEQPTGEPNTSSEAEMSEWIQQKLKPIIKKLKDVSRMINEALKNQEISYREFNELKQLQKYTDSITIKARDMLFGVIPVDMPLIDQNMRNIIQQWMQTERSSESSEFY